MKELWFVAKGETAFVDGEMPVCTDDTLLLKTIYSGLSNGTERNKLMGGNYNRGGWPDRIGYQHVSEVVEVGNGINGYAAGDVVFTGTFPGHVPYHTARGDDLIIALPEVLVRPSTALMGVACVPFHDAERARVNSSDNVLVYGDGLIGHFAVQAALAMGARVAMAGHHDYRLDLARQAGADIVVNNRNDVSSRIVREHGPYSAVFECSGGNVIGEILGQGWSRSGIITRHARILLIAGRHTVEYDFNAASSYEADFLSTAHFTREDLAEVTRLVAKRVINLELPLQQVVPIDEAIAIYDTLRDDKSSLLGVVFDWQ